MAKALSWRVVAWSITASVAYMFTGKATFALTIGFADSLIKIFTYYLHERAWMAVDYGRAPVARPAYAKAEVAEGGHELAGLRP